MEDTFGFDVFIFKAVKILLLVRIN